MDSVNPRSPRMRQRRNFLKVFGVGDKSPEERLEVTGIDNRSHASKHGRYMISSRHLFGNPQYSEHRTSRKIVQQFRLQAVRNKPDRNACLKCIGVTSSKFTIYESTETNPSCFCFGYDPNQLYVLLLFLCGLSQGIPLVLTVCAIVFDAGPFRFFTGFSDSIYAWSPSQQLLFFLR